MITTFFSGETNNSSIERLNFEPKNDETILFDDKMYEEGFGSDIAQKLNFVIWPALFIKNRDHNLTKIFAVFLDEIPKWNKKKSREMKEEKEIKELKENTKFKKTIKRQQDLIQKLLNEDLNKCL